MNNINSAWYVVFVFSVIVLLLIQSILVSFNIYDIVYLIGVIIFLIRFINIKKDIIFKK